MAASNVSILDTFYSCSCSSSSTVNGVSDPESGGSATPSRNYLSVGGTFTLVSGTTYVAYFADSVTDIASLNAYGSVIGDAPDGLASCSATLSVIVRLISVNGVTVQTSL